MKKEGGFTLIELMLVATIAAVLSGIAFPMYSDNIRKTKVQEAMDTIGALRSSSPELKPPWGEALGEDGLDASPHSIGPIGPSPAGSGDATAGGLTRAISPNYGQTLLPRDKKCPRSGRKN